MLKRAQRLFNFITYNGLRVWCRCDLKQIIMKKGNVKMLIRNLREMEENKQCTINGVSNSKADKREQAYQKFFYDHPNFRGKSIRYRGSYIFHKDEAYDCIDYYLRTGIEP